MKIELTKEEVQDLRESLTNRIDYIIGIRIWFRTEGATNASISSLDEGIIRLQVLRRKLISLPY